MERGELGQGGGTLRGGEGRHVGGLRGTTGGGFLPRLFPPRRRVQAKWRGQRLYGVGRFERSTGCCQDCGLVGSRLGLRIRGWNCQGCGRPHDRDHAAAHWRERLKGNYVVQDMGEPTDGTSRRPTRGEAGEQRRGLGLRRGARRGAANEDTGSDQPLLAA
ncbi:zinc ribbon domain-containing protein [Roseomonas chloroacetimidivorans]|uniref:zinc ribbon domain-containing protein n=1 Tax=Roseomonas chloroacetimidivorans TaxID=1766656 RepID=UPI003C793EDD